MPIPTREEAIEILSPYHGVIWTSVHEAGLSGGLFRSFARKSACQRCSIRDQSRTMSLMQ
jgi:hypothetical protein